MSTAPQTSQHRTHDPSRWALLVPGAGEGLRLGAGPKALLSLNGEPLWQRAVRLGRQVCDEVVLAVSPAHLQHISEAVRALPAGPGRVSVISGGSTRQHSVELALLASHAPMVMVQDAARPFASIAMMQRVAAAATAHGAAACTTLIEAPVVTLGDGFIMQAHTPATRSAQHLVHTPLAFSREVLTDAYARASQHGRIAASTVELVQLAGHRIAAVDGERRHFKITFPGDMEVAEALARVWI